MPHNRTDGHTDGHEEARTPNTHKWPKTPPQNLARGRRWTWHTRYLPKCRQAALETHRHRNTPRVAKDQQTRDPNTPPAKSSRTDGEVNRNTQIQKHQRRLSTGHPPPVGTHVRKRSWSAQARRPIPATPPGTGTHPGRLQGYLPAQQGVREVDSHTHTLTSTRS